MNSSRKLIVGDPASNLFPTFSKNWCLGTAWPFSEKLKFRDPMNEKVGSHKGKSNVFIVFVDSNLTLNSNSASSRDPPFWAVASIIFATSNGARKWNTKPLKSCFIQNSFCHAFEVQHEQDSRTSFMAEERKRLIWRKRVQRLLFTVNICSACLELVHENIDTLCRDHKNKTFYP